jgi:hypothetical protein
MFKIDGFNSFCYTVFIHLHELPVFQSTGKSGDTRRREMELHLLQSSQQIKLMEELGGPLFMR